MLKKEKRYKKITYALRSRKITDALPLLVSVIGYTLGAIAFIFIGYTNDSSSAYEAISLLVGGYKASRIISVFISEMKILLLIFLCGFSVFPIESASVVLLLRGFITGYSASYVYGLPIKTSVYVTHTFFSSVSLILFAIACKHTVSLSYALSEKNVSKSKAFTRYILDFLFVSGLVFILVSLRWIINHK